MNADDYLQFVCQADGQYVQALAVTGTSYGPNIPSIIVGIKQIAVDIAISSGIQKVKRQSIFADTKE
jgi:hypothetical protein